VIFFFGPNLADRYPTLIAPGRPRPHHISQGRQAARLQCRNALAEKDTCVELSQRKAKGGDRQRQRACVVCTNLLDGSSAGLTSWKDKDQDPVCWIFQRPSETAAERPAAKSPGEGRRRGQDRSGLTSPVCRLPTANEEGDETKRQRLFLRSPLHLATRSLRVFFFVLRLLHERKRETDVIAGVICYPYSIRFAGSIGLITYQHDCTCADLPLFTQEWLQVFNPCVVTTTAEV